MHLIFFLKPWLGLFHTPPEDHSQLPAEAELAARHLLSIVGFKELILGHSEGGFPIASDAWGEMAGRRSWAQRWPQMAKGQLHLRLPPPQMPTPAPGAALTFPHEGRDAVVHDFSGYGAVVGHGVLLHLFERRLLDDAIHSLLRQGAPHKLQDLLNLPFGVLEQWRGSSVEVWLTC